MDASLLRCLLLVTAALASVLLARRPVRKTFGAGPAFVLWLLPMLAIALPWLPALPSQWSALPAIHVLPDSLAAGTAGAVAATHAPWSRWLWLAGAVAMLSRLVVHYLRLRRQSRPWPAGLATSLRQELHDVDPRRLRLHPSGPAVLWAPRSLVLLPADFFERFDAAERRLVLRHELTHLRRGDALWSLVAELALALLWFHPLAWLARSRFRLDQELACDERVLRDTPRDAAGYAHTLLHSVGLSPLPVLIPWLAEPQLKERLTMIQRHRPGALRRRAGVAALAVLMAGGVFVAQAATNTQKASQDLTYNSKIMPRYPAAAIKAREQGTVLLSVLVHADGTVGTITYDPKHSTTTSADLIAAATDATRQWHFNPPLQDGKPIDGYARVPVEFSLTPLSGKNSTGEVEKPSSK
ncbi:energy transducer TonB [Rhodanobacter sp. C06]|uniref:M56 family metallopeptidase n=1 Tax=Rhodanobacter sp. C06 TaxID=1945854 RepID=UPI0009856CDA|nr:TonB family protein [Rhodanobacter sp. C06]OOG44087.1 energy transducer TonB [Rhodanobacter sp. C06]